ncbi:hypothetical protein [Alloalcanivorax dieselolei]|uniref:hypothetical protein n=1 Tax=Alloalcanivorax dieselolei TaxID=285091 RepID=UPI0011D2BDDE|nr:hypothetical protein [Alloalcanivorax dieselolei]
MLNPASPARTTMGINGRPDCSGFHPQSVIAWMKVNWQIFYGHRTWWPRCGSSRGNVKNYARQFLILNRFFVDTETLLPSYTRTGKQRATEGLQQDISAGKEWLAVNISMGWSGSVESDPVGEPPMCIQGRNADDRRYSG